MRLVFKIVDKVIDIFAGIAATLIGVLLVSISYATFSRFVFNDPKAKVIELSAYSLIYITFLAAPWLLRQRGHINVDLILLKLKAKAKVKLYLFSDTLCLIITSVLCFFSYQVTKSNFLENIKVMDSMDTPQYLLIIVIPLGSFFLAIQYIRFIKEDILSLQNWKEGEQKWNGI